MSTPTTLRIERPYSSLDAYVEGDAWSVDRGDMVLIGVTAPPPGTTVKFDVVLTTGATAVSGEGRVVEAVEARDGRPGGARVRFRQLDAASKNVLRKALDAQKRAAAVPTTSASAHADPKAATTASPAVIAAPAALPAPEAEAEAPPSARSGVRHRLSGVVSPPENREALLERLRKRAGAPVAPMDAEADQRKAAAE